MDSIRARVRVTLEIDVPGSWGTDCRGDQILKQATDAAMGAIARGVTVGSRQGEDRSDQRGWASVVGAPEVVAIIAPLGKQPA